MMRHFVVVRKHSERDEWRASCVCGQGSVWGTAAYAGSWKGQHLYLNEPISSEVAVPVYRGLAGGGNRDAGTSVTSPATPTDRPRVGALGGPSRLNRLTGEATR